MKTIGIILTMISLISCRHKGTKPLYRQEVVLNEHEVAKSIGSYSGFSQVLVVDTLSNKTYILTLR